MIIPTWTVEDLFKEQEVDVFINIKSMMEMNATTLKFYFKIIHKNGFVELSKDSEPSKLSLIEVKNIIKENKPAKSKKKTK